jgi:hypothetical protein
MEHRLTPVMVGYADVYAYCYLDEGIIAAIIVCSLGLLWRKQLIWTSGSSKATLSVMLSLPRALFLN